MALDAAHARPSADAPTHTVEAIGARWAVAAGHPLAAAAAARLLQAGGNAVDAGVAGGLCLGVVHPDMVSFAGVAPVLVHLARARETWQVSGVGPYPRAVTLEYFRDRHRGEIPPGVPRTVVPAAPAAWLTALARWGTMAFADVVAPALECAERGLPISRFTAHQMAGQEATYRQWPTSAALFLRDGRPLRAGEILVQSELAQTIRAMTRAEAAARGGRVAGVRAARDAFYKGDVARAIAAFHQAHGGLLAYDDLASFDVEVAPALQTAFHAYEVAACGFWCQGPVLLQMLNLLEGDDLRGLGHNSPAYLHRLIETIKLAFADREAYYGDPLYVKVPAAAHARAGDRVPRRRAPDAVRHAGGRCPAAGHAPGLPQRGGLRAVDPGRHRGAAGRLAQLPRLLLAPPDRARPARGRGPHPGGDPGGPRRPRPRGERVAGLGVAGRGRLRGARRPDRRPPRRSRSPPRLSRDRLVRPAGAPSLASPRAGTPRYTGPPSGVGRVAPPSSDQGERTMKMYVAGQWITKPQQIEVRNPYDNSVVDTVPRADLADAERALQSAERGARTMAKLTGYDRYKILMRAAEVMARRQEELGQTISKEEGKVIAEGRLEANRAIETITGSAEEAKRLHGETVPLDGAPGGGGKFGFTIRVPCGVVVAISPFNFPLNLVCHKVGPAIAGGNAVIVKPATDTPLSALKLTEILLEAGLPPEAINTLTGYGGEIGDRLVADKRVRKVTFTGSRDVGEHICQTAGIKRVTMELGSNAPVIVMPDANLEKVAAAVAATGYANAGQVCISTQRVLAAGRVYADFLEALRPRVAALTVGNQLDESVKVGPMVREREAVRVDEWVREAVASGARLVTGGRRRGAIYEPTIVADVKPDMRISSDELFGPAVAVTPFDDLDQAIALANDTNYGLSAGIFTESLESAMKFAREVQSGNLHVNWGPQWRADLMPYGGLKESGFGKEGPAYAIQEMTELKMVVFHLSS